MNKATTMLAAIVGAVLLGAPARGEDPKTDLNEAVKKLDAAVKKIDALSDKLKSVGDLDKSLGEYKASNSASILRIREDLNELKIEVDQLKLDVKSLRQTAAAIPPASTSKREAMPEGPKFGSVKLTNNYPDLMSINVNGMIFEVLPGQTRNITVDAGTFTYQVLGVQSRAQQRPIAANQEKLITIFPQ